MDSTHDLQAAKARVAQIDQAMASLAAERAHLNKRIEELSRTNEYSALPCWTCQSPKAADLRHRWNNCQNVPMSGSGVPMACCRIAESQRFTVSP
jgi:hypothetical protein